jgi:hypothetical protein
MNTGSLQRNLCIYNFFGFGPKPLVQICIIGHFSHIYALDPVLYILELQIIRKSRKKIICFAPVNDFPD